MGFLQELAAQKAELVDKTTFDSFENQLAYKIIDKKLAEIYNLTQNNPEITKKYVRQALAWKRLEARIHNQNDITLLKHECAERHHELEK